MIARAIAIRCERHARQVGNPLSGNDMSAPTEVRYPRYRLPAREPAETDLMYAGSQR